MDGFLTGFYCIVLHCKERWEQSFFHTGLISVKINTMKSIAMCHNYFGKTYWNNHSYTSPKLTSIYLKK